MTGLFLAFLAALLAGLKGKFILSINDTPGVREVFANFKVEVVQTRYSVNKNANKPVSELLYRNFK